MFYKLLRIARKNEKGFTLVELMVVVVIIGILTAVAMPQFGRVTGAANRSAVEANLRTIDGAIMMYRGDHGEFPAKGFSIYDDWAADMVDEWPNDNPEIDIQYGIDGEGSSFYAIVWIPETYKDWASSDNTDKYIRRTDLNW